MIDLIFLPNKNSNEIYPISVDFAPELIDGETLKSPPSIKAVYGSKDVTQALIGGSSIDGTKVNLVLMGGESGKVYAIAIEVETSLGNTYVAVCSLPINNEM